jgi:predicted HicB family RNase H-like nuclease
MDKIWERYTYRVHWSEEDQEYVAQCAELPGLSALDKDPQKAFREARELAEAGVELLHERGEPVPLPFSERAYSGAFKVRIPPEMHRRLAMEASEQGVSLNRLVAAKLGAPPLRGVVMPMFLCPSCHRSSPEHKAMKNERDRKTGAFVYVCPECKTKITRAQYFGAELAREAGRGKST